MKSYLKNHRLFSKSIKSIDKVRSSTVITDIISRRDINYNELELESLMDKIENLRNIYNKYKNKVELKDKNYPRNYIFWYILSKHYDLLKFELSLKKKLIFQKNQNQNIILIQNHLQNYSVSTHPC